MQLCLNISITEYTHPMKKPILSGLCLALSYLSFSQSLSTSSVFSPSLLYHSLEQFGLYEHNLNSQVSFLSQWSSIADHPCIANLGASYIPDFGKSARPEASVNIYSNSYGPFKNTGSSFSLGIIKNMDRNKLGYRGGIQIGYGQSEISINKLIWSEPELENVYYAGSKSFGLGYYLGAWYSTGRVKYKSVFSFSFESADLLAPTENNTKGTIYPYAGRYTLAYNLMKENSRLASLYQLDLDLINVPVHSISIQYYFPFKLYGGVIVTSTKSAGIITGFYWTIDNDWDTTFDINYQYLQSYESYGISAGDTHQIMLRCSGKF